MLGEAIGVTAGVPLEQLISVIPSFHKVLYTIMLSIVMLLMYLKFSDHMGVSATYSIPLGFILSPKSLQVRKGFCMDLMGLSELLSRMAPSIVTQVF